MAGCDRWEIESDLEGVCEGVEKKLGWPVFVKPANAGSSVGISKVSSRDELKKAIDLALENDRKVVFEAFVDGQEVECAVIGSDPAVATVRARSLPVPSSIPTTTSTRTA